MVGHFLLKGKEHYYYYYFFFELVVIEMNSFSLWQLFNNLEFVLQLRTLSAIIFFFVLRATSHVLHWTQNWTNERSTKQVLMSRIQQYDRNCIPIYPWKVNFPRNWPTTCFELFKFWVVYRAFDSLKPILWRGRYLVTSTLLSIEITLCYSIKIIFCALCWNRNDLYNLNWFVICLEYCKLL